MRSIFALFPEQLLNGMVSWGSPGKYSMIDCFLGNAFGVLSCPFWSTVRQCGARLPIYTLNYLTASQCCQFYNWGCVWVWPRTSSICGRIMYAVQVQVYLMNHLDGALPAPNMRVRVRRGAVIARRYTYAPPRWRTSQYRCAFIPCRYVCGMNLVTPYSMQFDWRVSRAGTMHFYWPSGIVHWSLKYQV